MEFGLFAFWLMMALVSAMISGAKRGFLTGVAFFFYGAAVWPIALVHALLLKADNVSAEGVIGGVPYWRARDGSFCARFDGRDVTFPSREMLEAALKGQSTQAEDDRLIGQKLIDWITSH